VADLWLSEIFSAIQGEGPFVGERQVFVRVAGCNLRCVYCDQPEALERTARCRIEHSAGRRDFVGHDNPLRLDAVQAAIRRLNAPTGLHRSVSFTGGEPLLQVEALRELAQRVRRDGLRVYLETHGAAPRQLAEIIDDVDVIAMDLKLPSSSGEPPLWNRHGEFLDHVVGRVPLPAVLFVKLVVDERVTDDEIETAARLVAERDPGIPFILQPVTDHGPLLDATRVAPPPSPARVLELQALAVHWLRDVRVIPQTHKLIGQL